MVASASLVLAGCGGNGGTGGTGSASSPAAGATAATSGAPAAGGTTSGGGGRAAGPAPKVGLAYDIGGRGDQSFNDAAAAGLDRARNELAVTQVQEAEAGENESNAQKEERLRQLAEGGFNPVIAVGFAYSEPLAKVAKEFPDVRFAIIDDANAKGQNIANLVFAENEGSFLVGVAAGLKTKTDNVGFVGGVNVPLIKKFEAGYVAGVKAVKPDAKVQTRYLTQPPDFTGFGDPAKGRTAAQGMFDAGADIVYHAAGGSGQGVFQAANAAKKLAIGVDSDQYQNPGLASVRDVILTSMLKKVDVAVFDFVQSVKSNSFAAGEKVYDLEANGVDYSKSGGKVDDIVPRLEEFKRQIISGQTNVPTTPAG